MIKLDKSTDSIVRHALVSLMRQVPWGPSRESLLSDSERFKNEAYAARRKVNENVLNELLLSKYPVDEARLLEERERENRFRTMSDQLAWKGDLYALAAAGRYPRTGDMTVANFAEDVVEDIRTFQTSGYSAGTSALRDISLAVSEYLEAEGIALEDVILPPTIFEMIDVGADSPDHVDPARWERAVRDYNHRMTLDNTPSEFIGGGCDYEDISPYGPDDDAGEHFAGEVEPPVALRMR